MLRRASKKFLRFDKKLFDTLLKGVYIALIKQLERFRLHNQKGDAK